MVDSVRKVLASSVYASTEAAGRERVERRTGTLAGFFSDSGESTLHELGISRKTHASRCHHVPVVDILPAPSLMRDESFRFEEVTHGTVANATAQPTDFP